jgi:peptidoglycan/LPS O-acetylase OafA/YrhL
VSGSRSGLRTDIQGLRAVAVLTVIASHAALGPFTGGFVGVDVFFVISGFLITQLLTREVERSGRLSIIGFYARRARRILPAATLVLIATAVASALWLGVVRAPEAFRDIAWAAFFAVNIRLARSGTDYFAQDLPPSPVQHYWSLAVEEQFYLVWPLLMLAVLALSSGRGARRRSGAPHGGFLIAIGTLTAASFVWSLHQTTSDPTGAYFSTLTRAWELGVGALGALWLARRSQRQSVSEPRRALLETAAALGAAAIVYATLAFDDATPFPGWRGAIPVLGSVAILLVGGIATRQTLVGKLLGVAPMRVIGDWSYSLYLWHWPLLIIPVQYLGHPLDLGEKIGVIALTFVLSALTYRLVENPFRSGTWLAPPWRAVAVYPATVILILAVSAGASDYASNNGVGESPPITLGSNWQARFHTPDKAEALVKASVRAARSGHGMPAHLEPELPDVLDSFADVGDCDYEDDSVRTLCPRGDVDSDRTLVLVGNSHARHWIPAFDEIAKTYGYRTYYLVKVQCVGSLVTPDMGATSEPFDGCTDFHQWALDQVASLHPDLVVVSTSPTSRGVYDADGTYFTRRTDVDRIVKQGYVDLLQELRKSAERTVLLADIPYLNRDPVTCLSSPRVTLRSCLLQENDQHASSVRDQVDAAEEAGVDWVPTRQWFCATACPSVTGEYIPYRDSGHMTNEYSAHLAPELATRLRLQHRDDEESE